MIDTPFIGLEPFDIEHAPYFFGRARDRELIAANLQTYRLSILYGPSGVGKTSVLNAGVLTDLQEEASRTRSLRGVASLIPVRFDQWHGDLAKDLTAAIKDAVIKCGIVDPPDSSGLKDFVSEWSRQKRGHVLVILDQFEDYFLYQPRVDPEGSFVRELGRVIDYPGGRAHFLIAIREDEYAKLDRIEDDIPQLFENTIRIHHLDRKAAKDAITGPMEVFNRQAERVVAWDEDLPDRVLDGMQYLSKQSGQGEGRIEVKGIQPETPVETSYLQLVMEHLWRDAISNGSFRLTTRDLNVDKIAKTHFNRRIEHLPENDKQLASLIFRQLVTRSGNKIAHTASDLADYCGRPSEVARVEAILEGLSDYPGRILRPRMGRYEIRHDALAPAILEWCASEQRRRDQAAAREREAELTRRAETEQRSARSFRILAATLFLVLIAGLIAVWIAGGWRQEVLSARAEKLMVERQLAEVQQKIRAVTAEYEKATELIKTAGEQAERITADANQKVADAETKSRQAEGANEAAASAAKAAQARAASAEKQALAALAETKIAQGRLQVTRNELQTLQKQVDTASNENERLRQERANLTNDRATEQLDRLRSEMEAMLYLARLHKDDDRPLARLLSLFAFDYGIKQGKIVLPSVAQTLQELFQSLPLFEDSSDTGPIFSTASSPSGSYLAAGTQGKVIVVSGDGRRLASLPVDRDKYIWKVAAISDRVLISADDRLRVWVDFPTSGRNPEEYSQSGQIRALSYNAARGLIASGTDERTVTVWKVSPAGELQRDWVLDKDRFRSAIRILDFNAAGTRLAIGLDIGVQIWDVQSRTSLFSFNQRTAALAYDPQSGRLAVASGNTVTLRRDDAQDGQASVLRPDDSDNSLQIRSLAFSPTGDLLAAGTNKKTIILWNTRAQAPVVLSTWVAHDGNVDSLTFTRNGSRLVSGGNDRKFRTWEIPATADLVATSAVFQLLLANKSEAVPASLPGNFVGLLRKRVGRSFTPQECDNYVKKSECQKF